VNFDTSLQKATRPLAIDLFAGVGGMSVGFEQAGFDVVAMVDYGPIHCADYATPSLEIQLRLDD